MTFRRVHRVLVPTSLTVVALAASSLVGASAATPASTQAGYLASPKAFHTAKVTLRVPRVTCSKSSPTRGVRLGLFAGEVQAGVVRPVSLAVEVTCRAGHTTYRAVYRNHGASGTRVHGGDRVKLILDGVQGYEVDDLTTGSGSGGGEGSPGSAPRAERQVLIGEQVVGGRLSRVRTDFSGAFVNHTSLSKVAHHRQGVTARTRVGSLHGGSFQITLR